MIFSVEFRTCTPRCAIAEKPRRRCGQATFLRNLSARNSIDHACIAQRALPISFLPMESEVTSTEDATLLSQTAAVPLAPITTSASGWPPPRSRVFAAAALLGGILIVLLLFAAVVILAVPRKSTSSETNCPGLVTTSTAECDHVVVGGGISGLYAGHRLQLSLPPSHTICLFEASGRFGGRLLSLFPAGSVPLDLGAMRRVARFGSFYRSRFSFGALLSSSCRALLQQVLAI